MSYINPKDTDSKKKSEPEKRNVNCLIKDLNVYDKLNVNP